MNKNELLKVLSLDEKIRLLNGVGFWKTYSANNKVPTITMSDGPHGLRKQDENQGINVNDSKTETCYPTASCASCSWDKQAISTLAKNLAIDALREKVNLVLGCAMNIKRSPLCGRNFEYFSEDPFLTSELASSFVSSLQKEGVGACIKHFACNNQEKNRQTSSSNMDERTLREIYLYAFEKVIKEAKPAAVMTSYNKINGTYASANKHLLLDILRGEWGYKGLTISDWGACIDAVECLSSGLDLAMPDSYGYFEKEIKKAIENNKIEESVIDEAVLRILDLCINFEQDVTKTYADNYLDRHDVAKEVALSSLVLLKNEGSLPLKKGLPLCVIGELAKKMRIQGGGSSHINTRDFPDLVRALEDEGFKINYVQGYVSEGFSKGKLSKMNVSFKKEAIEAARISAVKNIPIIFATGLTPKYEGEGFDRQTLDLPQEQLELLEEILDFTNNVIIVNFSGAPVLMPFVSKVRAILQVYPAGEATGEAVSELLCGKVSPSGHLSETWPCELKVVPCYKNFSCYDYNVNYDEQTFVGYRFYESKNVPVLFEFGYGLSYTTFEYSSLEVNGRSVSCKVKNIGEVDSKEVVQLYVCNDDDTNVRSKIELKGFEKIFLRSGQEKQVSFELDDRAFSVFCQKTNRFEVVGGNYKICIGRSVKDIRLEAQMLVRGESLLALIGEGENVQNAFNHNCVTSHIKGTFTKQDSLSKMAEESFFIRIFIGILKLGFRLKGKSMENPADKMMFTCITENPVESLISVSSGRINEKHVNFFVKRANKGFE